MNGLSEKQGRIYWYITQYQASNDGRSPTIHEIRSAFGYRSDNMVLKHIIALKSKGMLMSFPSDSHRSIRPTIDAKRILIKHWSAQLLGQTAETVELPILDLQRDALQVSNVTSIYPYEVTELHRQAIVPTSLDNDDSI